MFKEHYVQCIQYKDIMADIHMAIDGKHNKYVGWQTNAYCRQSTLSTVPCPRRGSTSPSKSRKHNLNWRKHWGERNVIFLVNTCFFSVFFSPWIKDKFQWIKDKYQVITPLPFWPKIRFLIVSTFPIKTNMYAKGTVIYNMGHTTSDNSSPEVEDLYCWCTCDSN